MTTPQPEGAEQLALVPVSAARRSPARVSLGAGAPTAGVAAAAVDPVAEVLVDTGLPHLDRPFEYLVPSELAETALPGVRVKVRFAGQDSNGFVLARRAAAEHVGRLTPLRRVVSPEQVVTQEVLDLCRAVAARYAGTVGDVLRLAVPPRHAAAEKALPLEPPAPRTESAAAVAASVGAADRHTGRSVAAPQERYAAAPAFLDRLRGGEAPAAVWTVIPATDPALDWPALLAEAAGAAVDSGRGAVLVVPDHRDVDRVAAALRLRLGADAYVRLTADQGPQARYTAFLKVLRGHVSCVVGTRAAVFAPVRDLGLVAVWDDGDDVHAEPRAPYPHVREVARIRAEAAGAGLLLLGFARSTSAQLLVERGIARPVAASGPQRRAAVPRVVVAGDAREVERDGPAALAHLPSAAWRAANDALDVGPVLVQVPRRGYLPSLSCQTCRAPARCGRCHGPLALPSSHAFPSCRWCGQLAGVFTCPRCGGGQLRSSVVGARRTAEELGRAFPGVPVRTSGAGEVLASVGREPALVIATPGAEPVADGGYAAVLLLDAWALLDRPSLTSSEEALRRWLGASALARGSADGGVVVLAGSPTHVTLPAVEALVRWAPEWFAERELAERAELGLPPAGWTARLVGDRAAVHDAVAALHLPPTVDVLGPLPVAGGRPDEVPRHQVLLRTSVADGPEVAERLRDLRAARSAKKETTSLTVTVDPSDLDA